jgi:multiple sugar transport system ATP-binding protein
MRENMAEVALRQVVKTFEATPAVRGIDLSISDKEFIVLVGPSGCGKSTTLRMIAGLEEATSGEIWIGGDLVNDVPPKDRDIAMVFQNYALYPHMSVYDNMAFGLKLRSIPKPEIKTRVEHAARILDITNLLDRRPKQLSGGQRQRVAMGRAIVRNPKVFLFDEPLSNLDAKLRVQMRTEIKKVHQKVLTTTVYVTHDQVEAMTLADRVVVMNHGNIDQIGTPHELYHSPRTKFVAGFIGSPAMNMVPCRLVENAGALTAVLSDGLSFRVPAERTQRYRPYAGRELLFGLRPEHIVETRGGTLGPSQQEFEVTLDVVEPMGMETMVYFLVDGTEVCGRVDPASAREAGERMRLVADLRHMHLVDPATEAVL